MANTATGAIAQTFTFSTQSLRAVLIDGEPWFVAADVCEALDVQNVTQAVSRLDDDERAMFNIGRQGEATVINESGLYSLILGSRKPEAKKFKKWVTSEVLPAIRKTGAYVAPNAPQATTTPPASVAERLNGSDMLNIKRMIWACTRGFFHDASWNQGIWFYLRQVLALPSPQPLTVEHLPMLAEELQRIHVVSHQVKEIIHQIECQAIRRIFRKGECADVVLADLKRLADMDLRKVNEELASLPAYFQNEHQGIAQRRQHAVGMSYGNDEKPGYFGKELA